MKSKTQSSNYLYVDIGGNGVQYQINDLEIKSFSTINKDKEFVITELALLIDQNNINSISISSPGACNAKTGWIDGISGIKNYGNFNIYEELNSKCKNEVNILVNNDSNCSLAANLSQTDYKNAVQINIGTGIGGSFAIDGNIVVGNTGYAGEFGYGFLEQDGKNTSESFSSNALVNKFDGKFSNAKEVFTTATDTKEFKEWINGLSCYLISMQYTFDPEVIFISGGITHNDNFIKMVNSTIKDIIKHKEGYTLIPKIVISKNINDGISGSKFLLEQHEKNYNT